MILTAFFTTKSVNALGFDGVLYGNPLILGKCLLVLAILIPYVSSGVVGQASNSHRTQPR